jgi:HK97 family phage major capsid protein
MDIESVALKVEQGVTALQTEQKEVKKNFDELQTTTKNAIGELTAVKNAANKQAETIVRLNETIAAMQAESRIGGDPLAKFCASPTRTNWLMGCFKKARGMTLSEAEVKAIEAHTRTAVAGDTAPGSYAVPQETANIIYDLFLRYGQWSSLGVMPIGSLTQIIPVASTRPTAYWVAQATAATEGAITGATKTMVISEAMAWIPVARPLLEDSSVDYSAFILDMLAQAVAYRLDWACFQANGDADTTDGNYEGIAYAGTAATATAGNTTTAALDLEDFGRCLTTVDAAVLSRPAKWWIHPTILAKIVLIRDANGRPIFQTALEAPSPGAIGSILGYPVILTNAMPSTDTTGLVVAVFGDPQGCAVGVRKGMELARSDEFQFSSNTSCYRAIIRAGVMVKAATAFAKLTLA